MKMTTPHRRFASVWGIVLALTLGMLAPPRVLAQDADPLPAATEAAAKPEGAKGTPLAAVTPEAAKTPEESTGLDASINKVFKPINEQLMDVIMAPLWKSEQLDEKGKPKVVLPFILAWLAAGAVFFTLFFGFINFRGFGLALKTVTGKYSSPDDPGEITHFQALTAAVSGTVGLGNIAGVAVAIGMGGPGAAFWMVCFGLLGMSSKFAECTLGVKYRHIGKDGKVHGGPMLYLTRGLAERGFASVGRALAVVFSITAVFASFGGGNMFQVNQACDQLVAVTAWGGEASWFADHRWVFGVIVAFIIGAVIIGGIVRIAKVTSKLVPMMTILYIIGCFVVLGAHFEAIPGTFRLIFSHAFSGEAMSGGLLGAIILGVQRAAFSNEAGIGSAPIAHAAVKTRYAASEGLVALLEPFADTVVICTMTALVVIVTGDYSGEAGQGITMTSHSFGTVVSWFPEVLSVAVILFALSTLITWSYYGLQAWKFIFGHSRVADLSYKLVFCLMVVVGSAVSLKEVIDFSDGMLFAMSLPNLIGVYLLLPVVRKELAKFREHVARVDAGQEAP